MVWNEITTPLSVDNLNNLESRITAAAANVNNGKALVADAITDMGVPAAGSDTFEQLDTKIRDIPQQKYASGEIQITNGARVSINPYSQLGGYACLIVAKAGIYADYAVSVTTSNLITNLAMGTKLKIISNDAMSMTIESVNYNGTVKWEAWGR